ncbi:MAG: hypothetical protein KGL95_08975, partial [Patescibacteria group bacterium]|nr:hypothetical protein [Patescibacteria group bacterium]
MLTPENFPLDFYISGILFPKNSELEPEDKEKLATGSDNGDENTSPDTEDESGWMKQNSIGLRCSLKQGVSKIFVDIEYGKYAQSENGRWLRYTRHPDKIPIVLSNLTGFQDVMNELGEIEAKITWKLEEGEMGTSKQFRVLTVLLSNEKEAPKLKDEKGNKIDFRIRRIEENHKCIFQPVIKITSQDESRPFFGDFFGTAVYKEQEDNILDLLLRDKKVFAQGYNCAALWDDALSPKTVSTEIIPSYMAKQILVETTNDDQRPNPIDMKTLANAKSFQDIEPVLRNLLTKYEKWISQLDIKIKTLPKERKELIEVALENKANCEL